MMRNAWTILAILGICLIATACEQLLTAQAIVVVLPQTAPCGSESRFDPVDTCLQIGTGADGPFFRNKIPNFTHEAGFRYKLRVRFSAWNGDTINGYSKIELIETLEKTPASN